jgi:hypothetical protein
VLVALANTGMPHNNIIIYYSKYHEVLGGLCVVPKPMLLLALDEACYPWTIQECTSTLFRLRRRVLHQQLANQVTRLHTSRQIPARHRSIDLAVAAPGLYSIFAAGPVSIDGLYNRTAGILEKGLCLPEALMTAAGLLLG